MAFLYTSGHLAGIDADCSLVYVALLIRAPRVVVTGPQLSDVVPDLPQRPLIRPLVHRHRPIPRTSGCVDCALHEHN
jgi:hypothetical protein